MDNKAIIFIDGNNFYHNIKLMYRVKRTGIKAGHIDYSKLSEAICSFFNLTLKKTRYYNSVPNVEDGKEMYWKHMNFLEGLESLPKFDVITRKLQRHSTKEILQEKKEIISNLGLCDKCKPLVEANCLECIGNVKKREKGIDVEIAIDMVEHVLKDKCDCIVLVSGDSDFIPALKLVEANGKKAYNAFLTLGYSYELREKFRFFIIDGNFLRENCLKDNIMS